MRATLDRLGNAIGGFCAAFVVYVVAGALAGRAIVLWDGRPLEPCWPFYSPIGMRLHLDTDTIAGLVWLSVAAIPSALIEFPALLVRQTLIEVWPELGSQPACFIVEDWLVTYAPAIFTLLCIAGFTFWLERARAFGAFLLLTLVMQIVAIAVFG